MRDKILGNLNPFETEPEWCLPPQFWFRAILMEGFTVYPLGGAIGLPIRQCHFTSLRIMNKRADIPLQCCTGYAESEGKWNRHSWVIHQGDRIILESTPSQFQTYYGVVLTELETEQFKEMLEIEQ